MVVARWTSSGTNVPAWRAEMNFKSDGNPIQESLRFPSDLKFINAFHAGTFLNCGVVPEDVHRATTIWGLDSASLKGRTTRTKLLAATPVPLQQRHFEPQTLYCDILYFMSVHVLLTKIKINKIFYSTVSFFFHFLSLLFFFIFSVSLLFFFIFTLSLSLILHIWYECKQSICK